MGVCGNQIPFRELITSSLLVFLFIQVHNFEALAQTKTGTKKTRIKKIRIAETRISGQARDKSTGEPIPFVNIFFVGTTIGTTSDLEGRFYLVAKTPRKRLKASYVGYEEQIREVKVGVTQVINFQLEQASLELQEVTVKGKRLRYRNKNNPAVALIRNVIDNREKNRHKKNSHKKNPHRRNPHKWPSQG